MKKSSINHFIIIFFIIMLLNCDSSNFNFFDTEPVKIIKYYPKSKFVHDKNIVVEIEFNKKMNKKSVENSFFYEEDGTKIVGIFKWSKSDYKMKFYPEKNCLYGKKYRILITKEAEDINGNDLKKEFELNFQLGDDTVLPYIIKESCFPKANSYLDASAQIRQPIVIVFSEPMYKPFPYNNISILPDVEGFYEWLDENNNIVDQFSTFPARILRFTPIKDYIKRTYYTVTVKNSFTDEARNQLREEYVFKFFVGADTEKPAIQNVNVIYKNISTQIYSVTLTNPNFVNEEVEKDSEILINFTEAMLKEDTINSIVFNPSVKIESYNWENNSQTLRIKLDKSGYFNYNQLYKLQINNSAKDTSGNPLIENYLYYLLINGNDSTPPKLSKLLVSATNLISDIYSSFPLLNFEDILTNTNYINYRMYIFNCSGWTPIPGTGDKYYIIFLTRFIKDDENVPPVTPIERNSLLNNLTFSSETGTSSTYFELRDFKKIEPTGLFSCYYDAGYESYIFVYALRGYNQGPGDPDIVMKMKLQGGNGVCDIRKNFIQKTTELFLVFRY